MQEDDLFQEGSDGEEHSEDEPGSEDDVTICFIIFNKLTCGRSTCK